VAAEAGTPKATAMSELDRARVLGPAVTSVGAAAIGLAAFLPWLENGHVTRNSFEMIRAAELLDVITGVAAVALKSWYFVPLLVAVVWLTAALERSRLTVAFGVGLVVATIVVSGVVLRSGVPTGVGPELALFGAGTIVVGVVLTLRPPGSPS